VPSPARRPYRVPPYFTALPQCLKTACVQHTVHTQQVAAPSLASSPLSLPPPSTSIPLPLPTFPPFPPWLQAQVRRLEREILFSSKPIGNAVQRMGLLFLRALKLRTSVGSAPISNAELNQRLADAAPRITQVRAHSYTTLHYTTLHCTTLHVSTTRATRELNQRLADAAPRITQVRAHSYTTLHYTTLHYTTLHYTTREYHQSNAELNPEAGGRAPRITQVRARTTVAASGLRRREPRALPSPLGPLATPLLLSPQPVSFGSAS